MLDIEVWPMVLAGVPETLGQHVIDLAWFVQNALRPTVHACAALSFACCAAALAISRRTTAPGTHAYRGQAVAVVRAAALLLATVVVILLLYVAAIETITRTLQFRYVVSTRPAVWRTGLLDIALLLAAALLALRSGGSASLVTAAMWLGVFLGLWLSLCVPAVRGVVIPEGGNIRQAVTSDWPIVLMASITIVGCLFVALRGWLDGYARHRAWPDRLGRLLDPWLTWPGFELSVGLLSLVVLLLGSLEITSLWSTICAVAMAAAALRLAHHRWNENLADAGMGLVTLAVVSLPMRFTPERPWAAEEYPALFNLALFGLAIMAWLWNWLAAVWEQQLHQGVAWTTTGRMIPTARRFGFLVVALGLLVSGQLAIWPKLAFVVGRDDAAGRWAAGVVAHLLLFAAAAWPAIHLKRATFAWLSLFAVASLFGFTFVRLPRGGAEFWIEQHWPVVAAVGGALLWFPAVAVRAPRFYPFREPLRIIGLLILPGMAVFGLLSRVEVPWAWWVAPGTCAAIGGLLIGAAWRPGPREFVFLTALFLAGAWWSFCGHWWPELVRTSSFFASMVACSGAALTAVYRDKLPAIWFRLLLGVFLVCIAGSVGGLLWSGP